MKNKVVCVFAHPDDEAFGPSGTIAKFSSNGDVYIICVTDGNDINSKIKNLTKIRYFELDNSAKILGVKKVYHLGYADGELRNNIYHEVAKKIEDIINKIKPNILITTEIRGVSGHLDHIFCSLVTSYIFRNNKYIKQILYSVAERSNTVDREKYFIFFPPGYDRKDVDWISDISDYFNLKIKSIMAHKSQLKDSQRILKRLKNSAKEELFLTIKR